MRRREISRREFVATSLAAGAALGVAIKRASAQGSKTVRIRGNLDIQSLDPGYMVGGMEIPIDYATLPRLAVAEKTSQGWSWKPSAYVDKLEQVDGTHIAFTLKPGLTWTKGFGEVTAEDAKFSFERILKSDWAGSWSSLDHVEVDANDKYSGVIVLNKPFAPVWLLSMTVAVGSILCKAAIEKLPEQKFTTEPPAECGPYLMSEWVPKQKITLTRNPDWRGPKPEPDEIQIVMIEDDNAAELAYEAGEVDLTEIQIISYGRYKGKLPENTKVIAIDGPYYSWMGINTEHPKLTDIRVRKALQRAIDVDSILQAAYNSDAPKAFGVVTPGVVGYRTASKYNYNPDEAKALLAEAGVSDLALELKLQSAQPDHVAAAQIIQANLAEAGVKVDIIPLDSGPFWNLGQVSQGEDWKNLQIWLMEYRTQPDASDAVQWFVKDQVGVWNWERWSDPEFEELWSKGLVEADNAKRAEIYLRMQDIMEDTGAYVWLTHKPLTFMHRDNLTPAFDSAGYHYFLDFKA
ncbi:MAG: ABC transporter substrate-binding protein [Dongiaceae bacterium]